MSARLPLLSGGSYTYRPLRKKSADVLLKQAKAVLDDSGYEEISLSSLSTSDYSELPKLANDLLDICEERRVSLSLPSLRADSFSMELMERVQKVRKSGLTFAAEAGSQRLRDVINKNITEEDLLTACTYAFEGGWNNVKLYFMMGLPTETNADFDEMSQLCKNIAYRWRMTTPNRARGVKITASTSCFVPKPQTPFQWDAQATEEEFDEKTAYLRQVMKTKNVTFRWHASDTSFLEGAFAAATAAWQRCCTRHGSRAARWTAGRTASRWRSGWMRSGPSDWIRRFMQTGSVRWMRCSRGITSAAERQKNASRESGSARAERNRLRLVSKNALAAVAAGLLKGCACSV